METLQPLINLLLILTALSVIAERVTNLWKHRNSELSQKSGKYKNDRVREKALTVRGISAGIILALLLKADFFAIIASLDNPWKTIGWIQFPDWTRSPSTSSLTSFLYTAAGCVVMGLALGFGSKFWHDIVGIIYELRSNTRARAGGS